MGSRTGSSIAFDQTLSQKERVATRDYSYGRLAAGKGRHAYIPIKMASGVQDITCVFVEVAGSYEKNFNLTVSWDGV